MVDRPLDASVQVLFFNCYESCKILTVLGTL